MGLLSKYTKPITIEQRFLHDDMGNCPDLLEEQHRLKIENNDWHRASGDVICDQCGNLYYDHKHVVGAIWLVEICSGELVKL